MDCLRICSPVVPSAVLPPAELCGQHQRLQDRIHPRRIPGPRMWERCAVPRQTRWYLRMLSVTGSMQQHAMPTAQVPLSQRVWPGS